MDIGESCAYSVSLRYLHLECLEFSTVGKLTLHARLSLCVCVCERYREEVCEGMFVYKCVCVELSLTFIMYVRVCVCVTEECVYGYVCECVRWYMYVCDGVYLCGYTLAYVCIGGCVRICQ